MPGAERVGVQSGGVGHRVVTGDLVPGAERVGVQSGGVGHRVVLVIWCLVLSGSGFSRVVSVTGWCW